jgi:hypothetical protein
MNAIFVCQITHNDQSWTKPAGCSQNCNKQSFVVQNGFHFDEWLFRENRMIDEYRHGFLQGVHRLNLCAYARTDKMDLILYTMEPMLGGKEFCQRYVGQIQNIECLNKDEIQKAAETAKSNGWLNKMKQEIKKVGGKPESLSHPSYCDIPFNIRFHAADLKIFTKPVFAKEDNPLYQLKNFDLYELSNNQRLKILHPILHLI